jgi:copper homeostasis protein (lipoprotein)
MRRTILSAFLQISLLMAVTGGTRAEGAKPKADAPLEKTEWKLIWLKGTAIETAAPQQVPYFQLDPDSHRVSGSGGCNRMTGGYELSGDHLKFSQMAMTRMACIHGGDTEANFSQALDKVTQWKIAKGKLLLLDADQHVLAKFSPYTPEDAH